MAAIELNHVTRRFPGGITAVDDCSLHAADGEYLVILGPSGCGKTTLLRLIAGLERPDAGHIRLGSREITPVRPHERGIGMIFQDSALYPHMTIRRNLAFPLRTRGIDRAEIERRVASLTDLLRLTPLVDRKPGELSGGERQRAALGRALIIQPRALLLDEPLSHLDAHLREGLRRELKRIHNELKPTIIHVTHDQDEAIELGERIAVMAEGRVQQTGSPEQIISRPANRFVAGFLGRPPMNVLMGVLHQSERGDRLTLAYGETSSIDLPLARDALPEEALNREVTVGIRPGAIRLSTDSSSSSALFTVQSVHRKVETVFVAGTLADGPEFLLRWPAEHERPEPGQTISITWRAEDMLCFAPGPFGELMSGS